MRDYYIENIRAREILDSRGNPTVEVEAVVDGEKGVGKSPSGASTGIYEACELRDNDKNRYNGKGVLSAVENVNTRIAQELIDNQEDDNLFTSIYEIDKKMIELDNTKNKTELGANAILATSIALARAMAKSNDQELFQFLGGEQGYIMPVPMMNILNGGAHASNNVDIQEFMIMPVGAKTFKEALRMAVEVYHTLQKILKKNNMTIAVGDEGGFAPDLKEDEDALKLLVEAIKEAGYVPNKDFVLAIDAAASEWKSDKKGYYHLPKANKDITTDELINYWEDLVNKYPIKSIEDGLDEEDFEGFRKLKERIGNRVQIVGDDLFVTNTERLKKGIENNCANSILIKLNQIGTISETIDAIKMAQQNNWTAVVSHRSGETDDTTISDLAVALNCGQIKAGAPARYDRVAKYNRLLVIEELLKDRAKYPGMDCFKI